MSSVELEYLIIFQEVVTYDSVDETYNVQKCTQLSDRVCDTVYDITVSKALT
jgi:hypothetical protein